MRKHLNADEVMQVDVLMKVRVRVGVRAQTQVVCSSRLDCIQIALMKAPPPLVKTLGETLVLL